MYFFSHRYKCTAIDESPGAYYSVCLIKRILHHVEAEHLALLRCFECHPCNISYIISFQYAFFVNIFHETIYFEIIKLIIPK